MQIKLKTIGMVNLIKTILLLFISNLCFSQSKYPLIIINDSDTLICFTTKQSKQMAVWNEERKECIELKNLDEKKITELENISTEKTGIISNQQKEINLFKQNIEDKDNLISVCEDEKNSLKKEVRKQRIGKWIAIIGGVIVSTLCLTL